MAVSIGSLILDLRASTDGLSKDAAKAVQKARRMGNDMAKAVGAGAIAAGAALAVVVNQASERIDKLAKQSDKLGVPIEKLRAIQEVGEKAGVGIEATTGALQGLQQQVFLAAAGSEKAGYAFKALGLDVKALLTLSPDQQMAKVADALNKVENQTVKAGYATKIFGDAGADMLAVFRGGSKDLADAEAKLAALGVTVSRVDAAKIEIANDALSDLKLIAEGAGNQLAVAFAPVIAGIAEKMKSVAGETHGFRDQMIQFVDTGVRGAGLLADAFRGWQVIVAGGKIVWLEFAKYADLALQSVGFLVLGAVTLVEKGIKSWREFGMAIHISVLEGVNKAIPVLNTLLEVAEGNVNKLIGLFNGIAGTSIKPAALTIDTSTFDAAIAETQGKLDTLRSQPLITKGTFDQSYKDLADFLGKLDAGTDVYTVSIDKAIGDLDRVLAKELPSDQLDKWLADVRAKTTEAAQGIAESVKPAFAAITVPPLNEDSKKNLKHIRNAIWDDVINPWEQSYKSIQDQIGGLVRGTLQWKDALTEVAATFVTTVIQSMVQMAAQWLATQMATMLGITAIQKTTQAASTASTLASAAAMEAAWIPAAIAASIATYGAAAWTGLGSFIAATALGTAAAVGIGAVGSIATTAITGKNALDGSRASGGRVNAGSLYQVNENGMELFRPDVSGEVVPMGQYKKELDSGATSAGMFFNLTQTFTGGVTRADLAIEAERIQQRTTKGVFDVIRRGGGARRIIQAA